MHYCSIRSKRFLSLKKKVVILFNDFYYLNEDYYWPAYT